MTPLRAVVNEWQPRLGLSDWTINCDYLSLEYEEARILRSDEQSYALIQVSDRCPAPLVEYTVVHELLHIVLLDAEWWMKTDTPADSQELADEALEIAINRLAKALTGAEWTPWHPADSIIKHERDA